MDQCQYSQVIYDTAVRENEAIYFGLLRLHALFNTREQNILLDSHLKVLDNPLGPERTLFHTLYDMGFKGQVFLQTMKAGSTVMAVRQLRYFERQRGRAIPYEEFSTCLQEMVDRHVPAASQQDYCPISSKKPPSIIGDLLTYFISYNVIGSGAREGRLHKFKAGLINVGFQELNKQYSKFFTPEQDEIILKRMYEDDRWELKLRKMYGLTKEEATSEKRFRLAAATVLHQNFGTSFSQPEWQRGRLVSVEDLEDKVAAWTAATSLGHCGDSAIWWWTAHGPGLHCWIGFHSTGKATNDGRTVHTVSRLSGLSGRFTEPASSPPCDDCASKGLPQCFMRYSDAVRHGFIEKVLGRALCLRLIKLLSSRIRRVLERKPELGAFELNVMCDWAEQMEMGEKLESWEEDENHLIES